jgi:hypothetical protein
VRNAGGEEVVFVRTVVERMERGRGMRACDATAEGLSIRLSSGEQVSLDGVFSANVEVDGVHRTARADRPRFRVFSTPAGRRTLDDVPVTCKGPPVLSGRVLASETELRAGERATVVACGESGRIVPCRDETDGLVAGGGIAPIVRELARDGDRQATLAMANAILLALLGVAGIASLPSSDRSRSRIDVVRP